MKTAKLISSILVVIMAFTLCSCSGMFYVYLGDDFIVGEADVLSPEGVTELVIDWKDGNIKIVGTESDAISVLEERVPEGGSDCRLCYRVRNGILTVKFLKSGISTGVKKLNKDLFLFLPRSLKLESVVVNQEKGTLTMDNVDTQKMELNSTTCTTSLSRIKVGKCTVNTTSGSVYMEKVDIEKFKAESVSSGITIDISSIAEFVSNSTSGAILITKSSVNCLKCNTVGGDVTLENNFMPAEIVVKTVGGNVGIAMPDGLGFGLTYTTVSGYFDCEFDTHISMGKVVYGNGHGRYDIETVSGAIVLKNK